MIDIRYKNRLNIDTSNSYVDHSVGVHGNRTRFLRAKVDTIQAGDKVWKSVGIGLREFFAKGRNHTNVIIGMDLLATPEFAIDYGRKKIVILERRAINESE